jgi:hypothetical protein
MREVAMETTMGKVLPVSQRLIGNPDHGGEHIIELY